MNGTRAILAVGIGTLVPASIVARAEVFLTDDQAAHVLFPTLAMKKREIALTDEQAKAIEARSGETVRNRKLVAFVGPKKEAVIVDRVLGKHESIVFAVGLAADGSVAGIEILEYRETYGGQVRGEAWRKQFVGKTTASPLKLNTDIKNISGATLSSAHVTAGVRRLLRTYDVVKSDL